MRYANEAYDNPLDEEPVFMDHFFQFYFNMELLDSLNIHALRGIVSRLKLVPAVRAKQMNSVQIYSLLAKMPQTELARRDQEIRTTCAELVPLYERVSKKLGLPSSPRILSCFPGGKRVPPKKRVTFVSLF